MVHIKKLEIYGFKSFGFKNTVINLEKGLVAVTGPNGSGKSNVLDAIMFAIGENSPKALRVDKFQSLFHDNQNSSYRLIRVSLTFDNTDRGIPVDSDFVVLTREMEGYAGDSQYHLNGKRVSKTTIIELLEIVVAAPNKLNIVQQGMITRISELNSEERRKIIEDIVGLSYFDDKKVEALKQLEESDRRLEVALARMGEIRKRIDELEAERNDQVRYEQLEYEMKRFKAVSLSNSIRTIKNRLELQNKFLDSKVLRSSELSNQLEEVHSQIEKLEREKSTFIQKVDAENKNKAQIGSKITSIVYESERIKAMLKESEHRFLQIEKQIPSIDIDKHDINQKLDNLRLQVEEKKTIINSRSDKVTTLRSELEELNFEIGRLTSETAVRANFKAKLENRYKHLIRIKNDLDISIARLEEKIEINKDKIKHYEEQIFALKDEIEKSVGISTDLNSSLESIKTKSDLIAKFIENLEEINIKLEKELEGSSNLVDRAANLTIKYEEKIKIAKDTRNEDLAIAELMKDPEKFGIKGLVHEILKWDKNYESSVLAAGSDWMKAFIVDDIKSMISIAEYAKLKKLPRLKIIPLDIVSRAKRSVILHYDEDNVNIVGNLADLVYSAYKGLADFIFGNTFLVRSATFAYILAKQGYRTVSIDGVLFEPSGRSITLDFGSKISDLTKAILLSDSVDNLHDSLNLLEKLIEKKGSDLKETTSKINNSKSEKMKLEAKIDSLKLQLSITDRSRHRAEETLEQLALNNVAVQSQVHSFIVQLEKYYRRLSILIPILKRMEEKFQIIDDLATKNRLVQLNIQKNQTLKCIEEMDIEIRQMLTSSVALNKEIEIGLERLRAMDDEKARLSTEFEQRKDQANELRIKLGSIEAQLNIFRDQEQQAIDSAGTSYTVLQEYEHKIKQLREHEKKISKEYNAIEKEILVLRKDIDDTTSKESHLHNDLLSLGYEDLIEEAFDVDVAIRELTNEFETLKTRINLRAHESYVQVIEGYRSMSSRKNELEMERNSIILFIEEIVKEKETVFMDAFKKVDTDIRKTFSELTGGQAWLEIENSEDIFSSGIMLMVQFPGKPGRESTALSGGEKTMAATIFLLALQSLKPSPFYLMDEIDAHLDAQNNERLSTVLLERSKNNQMIIVSLKDTTVAKARIVYGVYTKEGLSHIIRYRRPSQEPLAEIKSNIAIDK